MYENVVLLATGKWCIPLRGVATDVITHFIIIIVNYILSVL